MEFVSLRGSASGRHIKFLSAFSTPSCYAARCETDGSNVRVLTFGSTAATDSYREELGTEGTGECDLNEAHVLVDRFIFFGLDRFAVDAVSALPGALVLYGCAIPVPKELR